MIRSFVQNQSWWTRPLSTFFRGTGTRRRSILRAMVHLNRWIPAQYVHRFHGLDSSIIALGYYYSHKVTIL
jgi:hypothetical protein